MPHSLPPLDIQLQPPRRPMAPAVALALSLAAHGMLLWALSMAAPATPTAKFHEIALTLSLDARQPASNPPKQAHPAPAQVPEEALAEAVARAPEDSARRAPPETARQPVASAGSDAAVGPRPSKRQPIADTRTARVSVPVPTPRRSAESAASETVLWDLLRRIEQFKSYPRAARRAGIEGTARVWMEIDRDGVLRGQRLESSSGHRILDEAALLLVRRAAPYPPPRGSVAERIEVVLPVNYRLDSGS